MSLRPLQFTILQLATVIFGFALFCAVTRSIGGPVFGAFFSFALTFFAKRHKGYIEHLGCMIGGCVVFGPLAIGIVIASFIDVYLNGNFDGFGKEVSWLAQAAMGLSWAAMVSATCYALAKLTKRYIDQRPPRPIPDDTCGPIVWRRLDGTKAPASDLQ